LQNEELTHRLRNLASNAFVLVAALSVFELASGVPLTFIGAPSAWAQWSLILHVAAGFALAWPIVAYGIRHWSYGRHSERRWPVWDGYASAAVIGTSLLSGFWAAGAAAFGSRVPYSLHAVHSWSSYAAAVLIAIHLVPALQRLALSAREAGRDADWRASWRRLAVWSAAGAVALAAALLIFPALTRAPIYLDVAPAGYSFKYGPNPFAPSNAATTTGGVLDARRLAGSEGCGDCHAEIVEEWKSSAHHWSASDPGYRFVQNVMIKNVGREATRYCAACHEPVSLLSGEVNPGVDLEGTGRKEGSSCVVCHSISDLYAAAPVGGVTQGNGNYLLSPPADYLFADYQGKAAKEIRYFLIRSLPGRHRQDFAGGLMSKPEMCSTCHKQFIDKQVNNFGWVQLQNQYDDWRKGHYNVVNDPAQTLACKDCHMPLRDSKEMASSSGRPQHRSHRFIGANQAVPWLTGDKEQFRLTEEWLQGKRDVPEIAARWAKGPAIPVRIDAPAATAPGKRLEWKVIVTNNKAGHSFPTGPLDIIETWLEVRLLDAKGKVLYESGALDKKLYVDKQAFFFRSLGVDEKGARIDRHNLWDMVGQKSKRAVFVGTSDAAPYSAVVPKNAVGPLTLTTRLRYRKFNQFVTDLLGKKGLTFPITEISTDAVTIALPAASR
jgi:hypothetical protein